MQNCPHSLNHLVDRDRGIDMATEVRKIYTILQKLEEQGDEALMATLEKQISNTQYHRALHSALSAHMIKFLWPEVQAKSLKYEPLVRRDTPHFWHNFMAHMINTLWEIENEWLAKMKEHQKNPSQFEGRDRLYRLYGLLTASNPASAPKPSFIDHILIFGKFSQAIEMKFEEETNMPITDAEFEEALENPQLFSDMNALLYNARFAMMPLFHRMCTPAEEEINPRHFRDPNMPFRTLFLMADIKGMSFRLHPTFVAASRDILAACPPKDLQYNCPLAYNHLFRQIWDWSVALLKFYRLQKPLPPHIKMEGIPEGSST